MKRWLHSTSLKTVPLYRIRLIVFMAVKFFLQVYFFQRRHPQPWSRTVASEWEELVSSQAAEYRKVALRLEGLLIKLGQFLSTRADLMPKSFLRELENLVDQVPPVPWEEVKPILDQEWGGDYGNVLHKISVEPVASASIGVVYRGQLHSGEDVAVKIRRPNIDRIIRADFRAIRIVLWLARRFTRLGKRANLPALYREMVAVISDELNFAKELQNGLYFQERYRDFPGIYVPQFFQEHSTRSVLVMEWIEGSKISDLAFIAQYGLSPNELAVRLFRAFAEQLFQGGRFHADPHPGNLLLKSDGTIVIIDFGMIGTIRQEDTLHIQRLIEGIVFEDIAKILDSLEKLRFLLPSADKRALEEVILTVIRLYTRENLTKFDEAALEKILNDIQDVIKRQPIQLPSEFAFLGRALSTFVGVLHILDPGVDLAEIGKPIIKEWLANHGGNGNGKEKKGDTDADGQWGSAWTAYLAYAREWAAPLLRYPRLIEQYLEEPVRHRQWEQEKIKKEFMQRYFATQKLYALLIWILSALVSAASFYLQREPLAIGAAVAAAGGMIWFIVVNARHWRFLEEMNRT